MYYTFTRYYCSIYYCALWQLWGFCSHIIGSYKNPRFSPFSGCVDSTPTLITLFLSNSVSLSLSLSLSLFLSSSLSLSLSLSLSPPDLTTKTYPHQTSNQIDRQTDTQTSSNLTDHYLLQTILGLIETWVCLLLAESANSSKQIPSNVITAIVTDSLLNH